MDILAGFMLAFALVACVIIWRCRPPVRRYYARTNVPARIEELRLRAAWHREQLEAESAEFVSLHGYAHNTDEADELRSVIYDGEDYDRTLRRIMRRRARGET